MPEWRKRIAAMALGTALALMLLEVGLRIHNPFAVRLMGDRIILPRYQPVEIENIGHPGLDSVVRYRRNSLGFRGPEVPTDFEGHLTIIAVGGSTTESRVIRDDATWPHVLGRTLSQEFDRVWVNNAGLDGHSTFGHRILLEDFISPLNPDYTIFLIGVNDIERNDLTGYDAAQLRSPTGLRSGMRHLLVTHTEVGAFLNGLRRWRMAYRWGVTHGDWRETLNQPRLPTTEEDLRIRLAGQVPYLSGYRARVQELVRLSRRAGTEPILVTQPILWGWVTDPSTGAYLGDVRHHDVSGGVLAEVLERYNEVVREVGRTDSVAVVDLAALLPKDSRYYYDGIHFSNEGGRKVGSIVAEGLAPVLRRNLSR